MKANIIRLAGITLLCLFFSGMGENPPGSIKIDKLEWMSESLNIDSFRNGDPITEARTNEEWSKAGAEGRPVWCYYDNKKENGNLYGRLYNWYAIHDSRGLAP